MVSASLTFLVFPARVELKRQTCVLGHIGKKLLVEAAGKATVRCLVTTKRAPIQSSLADEATFNSVNAVTLAAVTRAIPWPRWRCRL